jgi:predicted AlkP superfamily phosphohydrolase/phosphomutase
MGIDSGNWRILRPLIESGRLPTIARLVQNGIHGDVEALWPPYWSTSAWGAIATGRSRDEIGVYEDMVVTVPGLPVMQGPLTLYARLIPITAVEYLFGRLGILALSPPPRAALRHPPVWEFLDRSGVKTAVVRFNFSYPARDQAAIVISNRVVPDLWDSFGVRRETGEDVVAPASRAPELLRPFSDEWTPDPKELERILPDPNRPAPRDIAFDPIAVLKKVLPYDQRTVEAGEQLLRSDRDLQALIIHFGGFDNVCHAFWQYKFPHEVSGRPSEDDSRALASVIDRYAQFLDRALARLIAAAPAPPVVMVVSDHGHGTSESVAPWKGWHASPGMFIASGPGVRQDPERLDVSYYDIAPTVLDMKGLIPPPEMRGRSVVREAEDTAFRDRASASAEKQGRDSRPEPR